MQISSMTGFARQNGKFDKDGVSLEWAWEIKSVNGKSLDVKAKLPSWLDELSLEMKNIAQKYFERGNLSAYLDLNISQVDQKVNINQALLEQVTDIAVNLYESNAGKVLKPSASELLAINGVIEVEKKRFDEDFTTELKKELLTSFEAACVILQEDRQQEGEKIKKLLEDMLAKIADIVKKISILAEDVPNILKTKLQQQIKELLDSNIGVSEERLAAEVVLLVNRADIREEIDRLNTHIKTAHQLLESNQALGRRLDFLCQEFNREANTTCSKASNVEIVNYGMDLKATIEQLREQVQNME